jgi:retron-type reverse transcriptase
MLAKLCCLNEALPQGAPTSPAISNLVMKDFDNILGQWCNDREITYTRYCDDLTFSSDKPLGAVYKKAKSMLFKFGFEINEKKTRFIKNTNRQSVTGITVNEKLSVSRDYKRSLRAELHAVFKFGLCDAMLRKTGEKYVSGSTAQPLRYLDSLEGKVRFVLSVEPENAYFLKALADIKAFRKEYSEKYPFDYMPFFS